MAWISYDDVRIMWAAEIADPVPSSEFDLTAEQIAETLATCWNDEVDVSRDVASLRIYNAHGIALRQTVTTTRTTYRALTRDLAERLADGLGSDNTLTHRWSAVYAATWSSSRYSNLDYDVLEFTAGPLSSATSSWAYRPGGVGSGISRSMKLPTEGRVVEAAAARANEADGWTVTVTATTYSAPPYVENGMFWPGTPPPQSSTAGDVAGVALSYSARRQFLFSISGVPLVETTATSTVEYRHLTFEQAASIVSGATAATWQKALYKSSAGATASYAMAVHSGAESTCDAHYVDEDNGWTVTKTTTTYSYNFVTTGAGWYSANL